MWTGIIVLISTAVISFFFADRISEGKIELIHSYHTNTVKEEDKKNYAKLFSKGLYVIGAGCLAAGHFRPVKLFSKSLSFPKHSLIENNYHYLLQFFFFCFIMS